MDFTLSEEDFLLQRTVRDFVENRANALWRQIDREDNLPRELVEEARDLGLLGMSIPPAYGGLGLSVAQRSLVQEMLGRGPWGLASFISVHTGIGCTGIVRFGSEEQKRRYLPPMARGEWIGSFALTEPGAGSDAGALRTRAVRRGDRWIVDGRKIFITNGPEAHHFLTFARTEAGISAFLIDADRPGVNTGQVFDTLGHRGSHISEVVFDGCEVEGDALLGEEGKGFEYAKRSLAEGRTLLGARCVGAAQKALELALEYGAGRRTFGRPLVEHQALEFRLAEMSARTEAAHLACYRAAWMLDRGLPAVRESSTAKFLGAEAAWKTVDDAVQFFGGYGYIRGEYMIERLWRDVRAPCIYDGSSEVEQMVIARRLGKGDVQASRWFGGSAHGA